MAALLEVTLYGKAGCGLCDEAAAMLARIGRKLPLRVKTVDIDADPDLQARYFLEIPVVLLWRGGSAGTATAIGRWRPRAGCTRHQTRP